MKKIIFCFVCILVSHISFSQTELIQLKKQDTVNIITDRPPQAIYFGLGGSGPIFSFNYDARFAKQLNGFGFTAGIGYYGESGATLFSIPVSINYLIGTKDNFFEVAAGITYINETSSYYSSIGFGDDDTEFDNGIMEHISLGYRYQHSTGGFFGRIGVSPLFYKGAYGTSFYLGAGMAF